LWRCDDALLLLWCYPHWHSCGGGQTEPAEGSWQVSSGWWVTAVHRCVTHVVMKEWLEWIALATLVRVMLVLSGLQQLGLRSSMACECACVMWATKTPALPLL
jgi:hypothetical protein